MNIGHQGPFNLIIGLFFLAGAVNLSLAETTSYLIWAAGLVGTISGIFMITVDVLDG